MARLLKGAPAAAAMREELTARTARLREIGVVPGLAILRVGEREDDVAYERAAIKRCGEIGVSVRTVTLPEGTEQARLIAEIKALNADKSVHGVLMFRPLPKDLDETAACETLSPEKDVDGMTAGSMASLYSGSGEGYPPCTAEAVMRLLEFCGVEVSGKRAAVIGRSLVIGRPVSMLLMRANATVTLCHTKTADVPGVIREADIVVAASGRAEALGRECFREGQTVVDVGINWSEKKQKLVGDVDFDEAEPIVAAITPVPGGVGSVTACVLISHVIEAAEKAAKK